MQQSLSYYLTILLIKNLGIKKNFSQNPLDYKKLRKADIALPTSAFFEKNITKRFHVLKSEITEIKKLNPTTKLVLYIHGGAFVSGPAQFHWDSLKKLLKKLIVALGCVTIQRLQKIKF